MNESVRIWHHGLLARWWAEFNTAGDDIDYFRRLIEATGEPALDAGCGTGRLLLPFVRAGLDVDGADASADMLHWIRQSAEAEGLTVNTHPQAMHHLDLPRRYRTILVCGAFGLGGSRGDDLEGLRRIHRHLEPGGHLILDHHLPNREQSRTWSDWVEPPELPRPWPSRRDRRTAADGSELELGVRLAAFDPLEQTMTLEMQVRHYAGGVEAASETGCIDINLYFKPEIELMLEVAGFREVRVTGFPDDRPALPWHDQRIVFHAVAAQATL